MSESVRSDGNHFRIFKILSIRCAIKFLFSVCTQNANVTRSTPKITIAIVVLKYEMKTIIVANSIEIEVIKQHILRLPCMKLPLLFHT